MAEIKIHFTLNKLDGYSYLDLTEGTILSFLLEDKPVINPQQFYKNDKIQLENIPNIQTGVKQVIQIAYSCDYSKDGYGLNHHEIEERFHYFTTQMEPDSASKVFPCFNICGLRVDFRLRIVSNDDFEFVFNTKLKKVYLPKDFIEDGNVINSSKNLLEFLPEGQAEAEFEFLENIPIHLIGFGFGNYTRKGAFVRLKNNRKVYVKFYYISNFANIDKITDFYIFNIADCLNL